MSKNVRHTKKGLDFSFSHGFRILGKEWGSPDGESPRDIRPEERPQVGGQGAETGGNGMGTERGSQCAGPRLLGAQGCPHLLAPLASSSSGGSPSCHLPRARVWVRSGPLCPPPAPSAAAEPSPSSASRSPRPFGLCSLSFSVT